MTDLPERDVAGRYAPMAEAFAVGDWYYAFHPRVPLLFPVVSGVIAWVFQCGGFWATKLASSLFFALGVFPLYGIFRRAFNGQIALGGCLLYVFCSHVLRLASGGLREEAKGFAFFLALFGLLVIWRERRKWTGYLWCGLGSGLLVLSRGDCSLYAMVFMCCALIFELAGKPKCFFPRRALAGGVLMAVILSPAAIYNYRAIGYPVPEVRIGVLLQKMERHFTGFFSRGDRSGNTLPAMVSETRIDARSASGVPAVSLVVDDRDEGRSSVNDPLEFITGMFKGFYPYFFCLALIVIVGRLKTGQWNAAESMVLAALLGHAVLLILQIVISDHYWYISRRYLLPIAPLSFGWTAIAVGWGYGKLRAAFPRYVTHRVAVAVAAIVALGLYLDAAGPLIKNYTSAKKSRIRKATLAVAAWIKADYRGRDRIKVRTFNPVLYYSDRRPAVLSEALPVVGYMAGGEGVSASDPELLARQFWPDYLVLTEGQSCPTANAAGYRPVNTFEIDANVYQVWKRQRIIGTE